MLVNLLQPNLNHFVNTKNSNANNPFVQQKTTLTTDKISFGFRPKETAEATKNIAGTLIDALIPLARKIKSHHTRYINTNDPKGDAQLALKAVTKWLNEQDDTPASKLATKLQQGTILDLKLW